jgi:Zn-dependent peptidase ImmA (M78 family)
MVERPRRYVPLPPDRVSTITDLAEAVADEYCPTGHIEPSVIMQKNDITSVFNDYGDSFDGMLEHLNGRFCIYCNLGRVENANSGRARFTLAHELGHYFIDDHRIALSSGKAPKHTSKCEFESDEVVEQEADLFASHLILPSIRFRKKAQEGKSGLEVILKTAEYFRSSLTSTAIRYVKSDFLPCALIKWKPDGTFHWKHLSQETVNARFLKTVEDRSQIACGSATDLALKGESPTSRGFFEKGTTAAAWFPFVADGNYKNAIFVEQAISLGRFGVLTFLFPYDGILRP